MDISEEAHAVSQQPSTGSLPNMMASFSAPQGAYPQRANHVPFTNHGQAEPGFIHMPWLQQAVDLPLGDPPTMSTRPAPLSTELASFGAPLTQGGKLFFCDWNGC